MTARHSSAASTLDILAAGAYQSPSGAEVAIADAIAAAVDGTLVFTPSQLEALLADGHERPAARSDALPRVEVTPESTQEAARRLCLDEGLDDLVLLNFASAKNPGGGFLRGAKAQEEDLARCSALYPCLHESGGSYYRANRSGTVDTLYTDHMIWSPRVPFFRVSSRSLIDEPYLPSVITAPAPNAGAYRQKGGKPKPIEAALRRRAAMVLALAEDRGHRNLLLGAWGCGVFQNDPAQVADAFASWLEHERFAGAFDRVCFAILDKPGATRAAFERRLL